MYVFHCITCFLHGQVELVDVGGFVDEHVLDLLLTAAGRSKSRLGPA